MIEIARTHKQYLFDCLFVDKQSAFNSTGPFTRSGHMVRNKLCWDVNCAVGLNKRTITSLAQLSFVLQVPLGNFGSQHNLFRTMCLDGTKGLFEARACSHQVAIKDILDNFL